MERCTLLWAAAQAKREWQEKKEVLCTDISVAVHLKIKGCLDPYLL